MRKPHAQKHSSRFWQRCAINILSLISLLKRVRWRLNDRHSSWSCSSWSVKFSNAVASSPKALCKPQGADLSRELWFHKSVQTQRMRMQSTSFSTISCAKHCSKKLPMFFYSWKKLKKKLKKKSLRHPNFSTSRSAPDPPVNFSCSESKTPQEPQVRGIQHMHVPWLLKRGAFLFKKKNYEWFWIKKMLSKISTWNVSADKLRLKYECWSCTWTALKCLCGHIHM